MNNKYTLEVCADSVESVLAAERGGADRIELCGNLSIGGTTPSVALFQQIRKYSNIKTNILIRPRAGDFCYTPDEFQIMKREIKLFNSLGANGVVIGILRPDGTLNMEQMTELIAEAGGMSVTLHRAFDMCIDPFKALEESIELKIDTILTSGQKNRSVEGISLLRELNKKALGKIDIMAGSGIEAGNIKNIYLETGIKSYHMSGKISVSSAMKFKNQDINMGSSYNNEYEILRTDERKVYEARKVLDIILDSELDRFKNGRGV